MRRMMRTKIVLIVSVLMAVMSGALATTIAEYDKKSPQERGKLVEVNANKIEDFLYC